MVISKIKLIFMAFFMLMILSIGAVSATDDVSAVDTPLLNDTTVDLNQNIASQNNDTVHVELMDENSASYDVNASGNLNNVNYYNSIELTFVNDLVGNYGNHTADELASTYNVNQSCVKSILQFVRDGAYGTELKDTLDYKDHVLKSQISSSISMLPDFSKLKCQDYNKIDANVAEKMMGMFGIYSIPQMTYHLNMQGIQINETSVLLTLYHIKMNEGSSGYGNGLQKLYQMKESYLNDNILKFQSYIINTEPAVYDNPNSNASNIIFNDVAKYNLKNNYIVRVVDNDGNPVTSGHISYFVNGNLAYVCKVNENGQAVVNLNDIFKSFGQYDITCKYSNIIRKNTITIGDISLNDFFNVKAIFEGVKVYSPGDTYNIKFIASNNKNIAGSPVKFTINNEIVGRGIVDENGFASFKIHDYVTLLLNSNNGFIQSELYDKSLNDYFIVNEYVTIGERSILTASKGSLLPKWRDTLYEICDDGYHAYIDENTYQLIQFDGNSFIVHVENIQNTNQLKNVFKEISKFNFNWDITTLNLDFKKCNIDFKAYSDREWDYAVKVPYGQLIINGNGANLIGNHGLNFMYVCNGANVILNNLNLKSFNHCFYNQGLLFCSEIGFYDNDAFKFDVDVSGSGAVIHNFNIAEFDECTFDGNNAHYVGLFKQHMAGSILYAEPYSTTYFYHSHFTGDKNSDDSIFACKYSSIIITPQSDKTKWTWDHFVGKSFIHPLASLTMVNPKESLVKDYKSNNYNPLVFNCTNTNELVKALKSINHDGIMGSEVIINLSDKVYSISTNQAKEIYKDYGSGYRGSFFNEKYSQYKDYSTGKEYYFINQGFVPITINGNGAQIKISGNSKSDDYHFAFMGKDTKLTLNNLKISNFNTAFVNSKGSLTCNNCDLSDNVIKYKFYKGDTGGVLRSFGGSSIFNNCKISNNAAGTKNTDFAYAVEGSYLELNNCQIKQSNSNYMTLKDSTIKCPSDLYNKHISKSSATFLSNNPEKDMLRYEVNSVRDLCEIDSSKNLADVTCIDFKCDCTLNLNSILPNRGNVYMRANGHNIQINSLLTVGKNTVLCLDGFALNKGLTNNGILSLVNCTLNGCKSNTMFTNNGQCSMSDCVVSDNHCKNVFDNKGSLTLSDSIIKNNGANKYGIIYNEGGSVVCINSTFSSNSGVDIYNFQTPNCVLINCVGAVVQFKEPMASWKLDLIKSGCFAATVAVTGAVGYGIGAALGPGIAGTLLSVSCGGIIGGGIGFGYGVIESSTLHDYSHLWSNIGTFAAIGFSSSMVGYSLGTIKYGVKHADADGSSVETDNPFDDDNLFESYDYYKNDNIVENDAKLIPRHISGHFDDSGDLIVDLDESLIKLENEINAEIGKYNSGFDYNSLVNELEKANINEVKVNKLIDKYDMSLQRENLEEFGLKTFKFLHSKYTKLWPLANDVQNKILSKLDSMICLYK